VPATLSIPHILFIISLYYGVYATEQSVPSGNGFSRNKECKDLQTTDIIKLIKMSGAIEEPAYTD